MDDTKKPLNPALPAPDAMLIAINNLHKQLGSVLAQLNHTHAELIYSRKLANESEQRILQAIRERQEPKQAKLPLEPEAKQQRPRITATISDIISKMDAGELVTALHIDRALKKNHPELNHRYSAIHGSLHTLTIKGELKRLQNGTYETTGVKNGAA